MKRIAKPVFLGLGASSLVTFFLTWPLLSPSHAVILHLTGSAAAITVPIILNFLFAWALFATFFFFTERNPPGMGIWLRFIFLLLFPAALLHGFQSVIQLYIGPDWLKRIAAVFTLLPLLLFFLHRAWFMKSWSFARFLCYCGGFWGLVMIPQLAYVTWQARSLNPPAVLRTTVNPPSAHTGGRVIWLLFDGFSYDQTYEHRYPGLALPTLDALAAQSTLFTQTVPTGLYTKTAITSLMSGRSLQVARGTPRGQFVLKESGSGKWIPFTAQDNIFSDAAHYGYNSAAAGWYMPYCRILSGEVNQCFWTFSTLRLFLPVMMIPGGSIAHNTLAPADFFLRKSLGAIDPAYRVKTMQIDNACHIQDYKDLLAASDRMLRDPNLTFVYLHLPVPHPQGIYDRQTGEFSLSYTTYQDNLALADKTLAHIEAILESQGQWDNSTIVLMGDHSWRAKLLWQGQPGWNQEQQEASDGGKFDDRPVYLVKLPGQHQGFRINEPYEAVRTRKLFDQIFSGRVRTPEQLAAWAAETPARSSAKPASGK